MVQKIVTFDVALKSTERQWVQKIPEVYTNDLGSVSLQFRITDCTDTELTGSTAIVLLKMRDGSFFQGPTVDVTRTLNVFSYTLKENEGNHDGLAEIQLIVTIGAKEFATQKYNFKVITGLDSEVAREIMIYEWSTLTAEARAYIDQFTADELLRDAEFDNHEFDRNVAFNLAQTNRQNQFSDLAEDLTATLAAADANIGEFDVALETGIVAANLTEKLEDFESTNRSRLLSVEQQLADKADIADLPSSAYTFKGSTTFASLPTTVNTLGDVRWATDKALNYAWTGTAWTPIGNGAFADDSVITRKLANKSVTPLKASFFEIGKNKFNKDTVTTGFYIDYLTGQLVANANYSASDWIDVTPNTASTVPVGHSEQMAFYTADKVFAGGVLNPGVACVSPHNAYKARLSVPNTKLDTMMFELGTVKTAYEPYEIKIPQSYIKTANYAKSFYVVDANGGADFTNITAALASVSDTLLKPITIVVNPGTYKETINLIDRYISLIGLDKANTIVLTESGHYDYPPMKCGGGKLYVENITFKATHDVPASDFKSTANRAYAVHADYGGLGTMHFVNCDLIAHQCAAFGSGLQPNQKYILEKCNFELHYDSVFATGSQTYGSVFCHSSGSASATPMNYEFYNCRFNVSGGYTLRNLYLTKQYADMLVLFVNCYVCGDTKVAFINDYSGLGTPYVLINPDSFGNNIVSING